MKQTIGIGSVVDDGTGDYLRKGGEKINSNFSELYQSLGDGQMPHPAGAWKKHTFTDGAELRPKFGEAFSIDTTRGGVRVILPTGTADDYGKVVKIRDVWGVWGTNNVTIQASGANTIKGGSSSRRLYRDYQDIELVLASPGSWEYLDNKMINKLSASDVPTVARKEFIAIKDQTDFVNIFGETPFNVRNIEVYRRGNLLFYGNEFSADSDFGSPGSQPGQLVALDGKSIRLKVKCNQGDVITIVTYLDDLAVYRTSYISRTLTVYNTDSHRVAIPGQTWVGDLSKKKVWDLHDFGLDESDGQMNPFATEAQINGRNLTLAGTGGLPAFMCESKTTGEHMDVESEDGCVLAGGDWVESGIDFSVMKDALGRLNKLKIYETLEDGDLLTVRWYNNDIGTIMGKDEIREFTDEIYLNAEAQFTRQNKIRYNDYNNPTPETAEIDTNVDTNIRLADVNTLLETVYPIGSVYMNAHNKNNPRDYMGFGVWVPYARGKAIVGWVDGTDGNFSYYQTQAGGRLVSPGGAGGNVNHTIANNEIPQVASTDEVLIKDDNGAIVIGQCLLDPDDSGPGYHTYREDPLNSNVGSGATPISLLQPYVTVASWLRVG